jgi:hypothetical protein
MNKYLKKYLKSNTNELNWLLAQDRDEMCVIEIEAYKDEDRIVTIIIYPTNNIEQSIWHREVGESKLMLGYEVSDIKDLIKSKK